MRFCTRLRRGLRRTEGGAFDKLQTH